MKVLIDITHPAHVHFYRNPIKILESQGNEIRVTSRDKDCTLALLDRYGIEHYCISEQSSSGAIGMARELLTRNSALLRVAREFHPDVLTGIGGVCAAQVGRILRKPSVIFYDTETARLQNLLTYPFATRIVVPKCYTGRLTERKVMRYQGYHELSYLHPTHFQPSREIGLANGLAPEGDTFLIRLVSWKASHDIGLKGWSPELLDTVVDFLLERGQVIISAEGDLPKHLDVLRYSGDPEQIHHLLAHCQACIGESATMASEAAILGIPALYTGKHVLGYIKEQCDHYGMVWLASTTNPDEALTSLTRMLSVPRSEIERRHHRMLSETVDVAKIVVSELIETGDSR